MLTQAFDRGRKSGDLPISLSRFIGRERELSKLPLLLREDSIVSLVGPGGCGKTRLAVEVARRMQDGLDGGCWFVDLTILNSGEPLPSLVTSILGLPPSTDPLPVQLTNHFSERQSLLILDNCEHLIDEVAALADSIVQRCPQIRLLATSREPLGVEGERVYRVGSLTRPEAVALFLDRAERAAAEIGLTKQDEQTVAAICERLDGIPLALELAAGCIGSMTPQGILRGLDRRFLLLVGRRRASPRHRTLRAAFEWSEELLTPADRQLFYRLGVFVGGFDDAAAVAVGADADCPPEQVTSLLRRLVERSMVMVDRQAGFNRYRLLETLRDYALEQLVKQQDAERTRSAHAIYFSEQARTTVAGQWPTSQHGPGEIRAARHMLRLDLGNYRASLEYAQSTGSPLLATLALHLTPLWSGVTGPQEGRLWLEAALSSISPDDKPTRRRLTQCLVDISALCGDLVGAESYGREYLTLAEESGDPHEHWEGLLTLGQVEAAKDMAASRSAADRALELARSLADPSKLVRSLVMAAAVRRCVAEELDRAQAMEGEMVAALGRVEDPATQLMLQVMVREHLAENQIRDGDAVGALRVYRELLHSQSELLESEQYDYPHLRYLAEVAALLVMTGRPARGVRLAGAIDNACEQRGFALRRELLDDALRAMGTRGRAIYDAGRAMSVGEAKAYAMDDTPDEILPGVRLTRREREVADLVREGLTDPQIAERLFLSVRTVEGHVENLRGKLSVSTRAGVAAWAAVNLP